MPVPVFCCLFFSGFPLIKSAPKIPGKIYKKSAYRKLLDARRRARGEPGGAQAATWHGPPPGRARRAPAPPGPPPVPPFGLYYLLVTNTLKEDPISRFPPLFHRRSASKIGSIRRPLLCTLSEGGITSGSLSTTMSASRMSRE